MTALSPFLRKTPAEGLREYFEATPFEATKGFDWSADESEITERLIRAVEDMTADERARVVLNAARVGSLADDAGLYALQSVVRDRTTFDSIESRYHRALRVFVREPDRFRLAEEVRFNDENRRGKMWDGFEAEPETPIARDPASVRAFSDAVRAAFETSNVQIDLFDRCRLLFDGRECQLVQIAVYREGHPTDSLEFGPSQRLRRRVTRPVYEAALTYEPATGTIEVVANTRANREALVELMMQHLLGASTRVQPMVLRQYDLRVLLRPFDFPTDPEDGIRDVVVKELRFLDLGNPKERIPLESMSGADRSIWDMARARIGLDLGDGEAPPFVPPDAPEWVITRAHFTIRFYPVGGAGRGRSLTLTVTMPHGCSLRDMTPEERLIGEKYLRRWGMLREAEDIGDLVE